ncbi:MAG: DUF5683 domain-containing protein [Ignavibacteriales bacterium]|nr:DUF5683 domain-containing protein [Ignavibacteriales bacterium]
MVPARLQLNITQMMNWKDYLNSSKSSINHIIKTVFFVLVFAAAFAQIENAEDESIKSDSVFISTKSPWTAVLMSAVIPGAGQIYNESYWKAPLIWALSAMVGL